MSTEKEIIKLPHKAVVLIRYEVMEVNNLGQVTGNPLERKSTIISFSGDSLEECKTKLNAFMETCKNG